MSLKSQVKSKEKHDHYPATMEDAMELYDDLRELSGLSHEHAVETMGYAAEVALANCDRTGPLAAFIMRTESWLSPTRKPDDLQLFYRGIEIAMKERDAL